ncbi:uncharacterized protein LOC118424026 isoform X1 [Branchiostoma floridae]|uniref:Poly [ADP-ribose] polymerase n=1 Tax=Branchiostoma floridae TaxID=7739 RepID=A0A9J7N306_BRAFL|nr:uncharacterized protein LOC118424026 isoform X1 [Branchiostoma floridae]XP_035688340.1 uncharacterized protein LOC118424026 isoform X1 [Branchiostoma floridae]
MADPDSPLGNFRGPDMPSLPGGVDINTAQAILTALGANTTNQLLGTDSADGINNNEDSPMLGSVRRELRLQEEVRLRSQGAPWGQGSSSEAEGDAERERRMQTEWEREEAEEDMILSQALSQQRPQVANTGSATGRLEMPNNTDGGLEDNMIVQEATASSSVDQLVPNRRRSVEIEDDIADELKMDGAQGSSTASTSGSQRRRSVDMEEDVAEEVRIAMGAASNNSTNVSSSQPQFGATASCSTGVTRGFPSAGAMMPYPVDPNYDEKLPCNWTLGLDRDQPYHHIRLLTTSEEYRLIAEEFSRVNITVESIDRVQNRHLWDRFQDENRRLKDIHSRSNSFNVNEQYLFHGTQSSAINEICEDGLDQRLSRIGNFGRGIYFSDDPRKCANYSDQDSNPCILKCRVLLGDVKVYPHGQTDKDLRREPLRENKEEGMPKSYDSVQGCVREYNEFVIYSSYRTIPEYIIYYRVPGTASRTTQGNAQAQTGIPSTSASATVSRSQSVSSESHPEMEDDSEEMGAAPTAARTEDEHPEVRRSSNSNDNPVAMATGSGVPPAASAGTGEGLDPHEERIRRVRAIVQAERRAEAEARQRRLEASAQSRRDRAAQAEQQGQGAQPSDLAVSSEPPKEVVDEHEAKLLRVRKIVQDRRKLEKLMKSAGKESDIDALMKVYDETYGQAPQGTTSDSDDPVTIVMAFLIPDFLEVTGTDLDTAKSFLRQANMDLQKAIDLYFRCQ